MRFQETGHLCFGAFTDDRQMALDGLAVDKGMRVDRVPKNSAIGANGEVPRPQINIVLNWHRELLERVPVD